MERVDPRLILDAFSDAVVTSDGTKRITYLNQAATRLFGWSAQEAIGQPLGVLVPERLRARYPQGYATFFATLETPPVGKPIRLPVLHKEGHELEVEVTLMTLPVGDGELLLVAAFRDLRERLELERRARGQRKVEVQFEVMRALTGPGGLHEAMERALDAILAVLGLDVGIFWGSERGGDSLTARVLSATEERQQARFLAATAAFVFTPGEGLPGRVARTGDPLWIPDLGREARYHNRTLALELGLRSAFIVPLTGARAHGALELLGRSATPPDEDMLHAMATLGFLIGQFIDRLEVTEELRERSEWLDTTLQSIGDAVIATDTGGCVDFMNPLAERLTGWSEAEARGRRLVEVFRTFRSEDWTPIENPASRVLRRDEDTEPIHGAVLLSRDGSELAIEDRAAPITTEDGTMHGVVLVFRDVTAKRRMESSVLFLAEANDVLSSSLDYEKTLDRIAHLVVPRLADWCAIHLVSEERGGALPLTVAHKDPTRLEWARAMLERYPPEPDVPTGVTGVLRTGRPELYPEVTPAALAMVARGEEHRRFLEEVGMRSVMIVPLSTRGRPFGTITFVSSESGRTYDADSLGTAQELAARASRAVENARLYHDAQDAIRLRDDFLSIASHELKTPLTPLSLHLQSIRRHHDTDEPLSPRLLAKLDAMARQVSRLESLVTSLLELSRIRADSLHLERERFELSSLVREVGSRFESQARYAGSEVRLQLEEGVEGCWDRSRLDQVLSNLIANALKFGAGHPVDVTLRSRAERAELSVRDHGPGIALEDQQRVFERFERLVSSRQYGGFGLGLWITRQIVEALGGTISLESEPGRGATFTVTLSTDEPAGDAPECQKNAASST